MTTNHGVFESTFQKTREWIHEIQEEIDVQDEREAYAALRAVLHTLRDRLTVEEAADLGAQLPMMIRGTYYEGWNPSNKPQKIRTAHEFLYSVDHQFAFNRSNKDPRQVIAGVLKVLEDHVSKGEIKDVKSTLPQDILSLWPKPSKN
jgi:uncharacterized protein (DUF2267 family)